MLGKSLLIAAALTIAACSASLFAPVVAFAQTVTTASPTTVNVGDLIAPWLQMLVGAVAILIGALLTYVTALIKSKTGIDIEARYRQTLQDALTNAAGLALTKVSNTLADKTLDVHSEVIKDAILYVNKAAPDAILHFGLSPAQIAEKITAKVGVITANSDSTVGK